jgi:hypothetical protein
MTATSFVVGIDEARDKLALQDLPEVNDAIARGLTAAHVFFSSVLGTSFEESLARKDVFFLDSALHPVRPHFQFRLRLTQAFVKPGSVSLFYAGSRRDVLDPSMAAAISSTEYYVDTEKGIVYLDDLGSDSFTTSGVSYRDKFVRVDYDAGFGATTGVTPPEWLKEAILAWLPSAIVVKSQDIDGWAKTAMTIRQLATDMVAPYTRESAFNFHPIY